MDLHHISTQEVLERISRHCPEAMSTYLQIINRTDDLVAHFNREMVDIDMSEEWPDFMRNIKKLAREGLIEWHPMGDDICVRICGYDEDE